MSEPDACPSCGESLEIRPVDAACPDCAGRFEAWSDRVARLVAGREGGADGAPGPVVLQSRQYWFNAALTPGGRPSWPGRRPADPLAGGRGGPPPA